MFTQAMGAWEKAVCPSYCLAVAKTLNLGPNEMTSLCRRLVDSLNEGKRHLEASHLLLEYLVTIKVDWLSSTEMQRISKIKQYVGNR